MMSGSTSAHQLFITPHVMRLLLELCPCLNLWRLTKQPTTAKMKPSCPNDALPTVLLIEVFDSIAPCRRSAPHSPHSGVLHSFFKLLLWLLLYACQKLLKKYCGRATHLLPGAGFCLCCSDTTGSLGNSQSHLTSAFHTLDHNIVINSQRPGLDFGPGL